MIHSQFVYWIFHTLILIDEDFLSDGILINTMFHTDVFFTNSFSSFNGKVCSKMLSNEKRSFCLTKFWLKFCFAVFFSRDIFFLFRQSFGGWTYCERTYDINRNLQRDYARLRLNKFGSDRTLTSVDGQVFSVHRCILEARAPLFTAMLNASERTGSGHFLGSMDSGTLDALLAFLYAGSVEGVGNTAMALLPVTDTYQLVDLKTFCELSLRAGIADVADAARFLILADKCHSADIKTRVLNVLKKTGNVGKFVHIGGAKNVRE